MLDRARGGPAAYCGGHRAPVWGLGGAEWWLVSFMIVSHLIYIKMVLFLKGNLAHKFKDLYFLCFIFDLHVVNTSKTKKIGNTG